MHSLLQKATLYTLITTDYSLGSPCPGRAWYSKAGHHQCPSPRDD